MHKRMRTRPRSAVCFSLAVAAALASACIALGGDSETSREELYRRLVSGMKSHRQKLTTGVFRARGVKVFETSSGEKHQGDVSFFCAFDHAGDRIRFDRQEPVPHLAPGRPAAGEWHDMTPITNKYFRTPELSAHQTTGGPNPHISTAVSIHGPDYVPPSLEARPLDVRSFGLYYWPGFGKGTDFETLHDALAKTSPDKIVDEGNGLYRLVWNFKSHRCTLGIDESKGCSPVRLWAQGKSAAAGQLWDEDPETINDVTYLEVTDVWVPSTFRFRVQRGTALTYRLELDWQSVNKPVPDKCFSYEDFQLEGGTSIVDCRSGESVILEEVGRDRPDFGLEE